MSRARTALVLGLDGGSFDVIRPLAAEGRLPHLAAWMTEGLATPLLSTVPPMSFPAWSSFLTGLGPGRHGVFDFTQRLPGAYRIRFVNASHRRGASLFTRISQRAATVLSLGVPATFPPEPVAGLLVCGFDAPVSTGSEPGCASDPALYRSIARRVGPWMEPALDEAAQDEGWHDLALPALLRRIDRKTGFALEALRQLRERVGRPPELMTVIFSESDTVAHHFWRDHDPASPRHDPCVSLARKQAIARVYERIDAALGELRQAFGEEALCLVISDHGAGGASHRVLHLNARLAQCGLLARRGGGLDGLARRARDGVLRGLGPRRAQALFRRGRATAARLESLARFGGIRWRTTVAFSEEANTQPGVWVNLRGREAEGCVSADDYERVRGDVIEALQDWKLPGGAPVVARARRREEIYAGPCVERAPDVVVELALEDGYAHSLVPTPWGDGSPPEPVRTLEDDELAGGRGRGMNGTHRPEGILIAAGGDLGPVAAGAPASIVDVAPTVLNALGIESEAIFDGIPLQPVPVAYTPEQEERVAARLRSLGYLE
jgi:predicted AlkP superfamily phosphohydrolase/phosphomutase